MHVRAKRWKTAKLRAQAQCLHKRECRGWVHVSERMRCGARRGRGRRRTQGGKHSGANAHSTGPFCPLNRKSTCAINWYLPPLRRSDHSLPRTSFLLWDLPNWEEILFGNLAKAIAALSYINGSRALPKKGTRQTTVRSSERVV